MQAGGKAGLRRNTQKEKHKKIWRCAKQIKRRNGKITRRLRKILEKRASVTAGKLEPGKQPSRKNIKPGGIGLFEKPAGTKGTASRWLLRLPPRGSPSALPQGKGEEPELIRGPFSPRVLCRALWQGRKGGGQNYAPRETPSAHSVRGKRSTIAHCGTALSE